MNYIVDKTTAPSIPPAIVDMRRCPRVGASLRLSECVRCDWCSKMKCGPMWCHWEEWTKNPHRYPKRENVTSVTWSGVDPIFHHESTSAMGGDA